MTTSATTAGTVEFQDLTALVTGGASGIGAAVADRLAAGGARVAVLDLNPDGTAPFGVECNVADDASVRAAVDAVTRQFGRLDIVVNNAGIGAMGDVAANNDDEWSRVLDINVVGVARVSRPALPLLRQSPAAAIVNVCSIAATAGLPQRALYSASKGAVPSLTLAMAADHVREGIRVNCVNPGTVDTPWVARLLASAADSRVCGFGRWGNCRGSGRRNRRNQFPATFPRPPFPYARKCTATGSTTNHTGDTS